jgi:hypothetical protein
MPRARRQNLEVPWPPQGEQAVDVIPRHRGNAGFDPVLPLEKVVHVPEGTYESTQSTSLPAVADILDTCQGESNQMTVRHLLFRPFSTLMPTCVRPRS